MKSFFKKRPQNANLTDDLYGEEQSAKYGSSLQLSSTLLIVEDNEDISTFLSSALSSKNFTVYLATNGLEAIQFFHTYRVDLMLTDICMMGINGNILCKQFKKEGVPVIAITGTPWLANEAFDYVIPKPFTVEEILSAISLCLTNNPQSLFSKVKETAKNIHKKTHNDN